MRAAFQLAGAWVRGDKGTDLAEFRTDAARIDAVILILPRGTRRSLYFFDRLLFKHDPTFDDLLCRINRYQHIDPRYAKLAEKVLISVDLAAIFDSFGFEV